jgi:hypothetical protein
MSVLEDRLVILTATKNDIESQIILINQQRTSIRNTINALKKLLAGLAPGSAQRKYIEAQIASLEITDQSLAARLAVLQIQLNAVLAEIAEIKTLLELGSASG